ncbi:ABC transporter ATP-binding protein [Anaerolineaceae bacterium oral taxon 439]|nr:ABC transporter ATP-binding protein [Anaerolineaceae bacterium oral taxon 439]
MAAVELRNVSYAYPLAEEKALRNISVSFEAGKLYGIIGPNGSGKTTLCNLVRGLAPYFYRGELEGECRINGRLLKDIDFDELSVEVGFIFQNPFTQISGVKETVFEEIAMGLENLGVSREDMIRRTVQIIRDLGIEDIMDKNPNALSGGQKQRVAFASIIVMEPPIIVIDEPTSQLDPHGTDMIFEIIYKMKERGKTILLVEHKVDLLADYADEILVLNKGELVAHGPTREILTDDSLLNQGTAIPEVALLGRDLKLDGLNLPEIPITIQRAAEVLSSFVTLGAGS